ncbi:MAG: V-type ATP synthase subunit A [Spirochaetes bacterium]|nr:MAG: V-type ATP synthase subunit A [Spirochaetota bacterium]
MGKVKRVNGPIVIGESITPPRMLDVAEVSEYHLVGEIMRIDGKYFTIQVYEDTTLVRPGDNIYGTGMPLSVELGPGLLGMIYDGIQRPLESIREVHGAFIKRGSHPPSLNREKKWHFIPSKKEGDKVKGGEIIGEIQETPLIKHKIMLPPEYKEGIIKKLEEGDYTIEETVGIIELEDREEEIKLYQRWPVRKPRPVKEKLNVSDLLVTGQRVIDTLFPLPKGGTCAVPGGFGTGKTMVQHQLAKWSNADVIVYIGCGERGNEMTDVLLHFPQLTDPNTGHPLMERTILIANTSNMPVAAREASIYTGVTIAEYYRDMGYDVAIMADSTSRWAEALRELSGRMEELPAEEGFPAYLPTRLAEFYERAGRVKTLSDNPGSVTIIGAVSPPGGDFSEPVTQHTKRFVRAFWALDRHLANERHYPAISWLDSYSEYVEDLTEWWEKNIDPQWSEYRKEIMNLLYKEIRLQQIVKLVGPDALPDSQKFILEVCKMFKVAFLQQNAFDKIDTYTVPEKQWRMLKIIVLFYKKGDNLLKSGFTLQQIKEFPVYNEIYRMKYSYSNEEIDKFDAIIEKINRLPQK